MGEGEPTAFGNCASVGRRALLVTARKAGAGRAKKGELPENLGGGCAPASGGVKIGMLLDWSTTPPITPAFGTAIIQAMFRVHPCDRPLSQIAQPLQRGCRQTSANCPKRAMNYQ